MGKYDDIDYLNKANVPIRKEIERFIIKQHNTSSWLGKWYWQIRIDKLKKTLHHYEN